MTFNSINSRDAKSIFLEAIELPVQDRQEFVIQACGGDSSLTSKVHELIAFFEKDCDSILDTEQIRSALRKDRNAARTLSADVLTHKTSENELLGRYMLLGVASADSWGTVYRAIQMHPVRRYVFLKVLNTTESDSVVDQIRSAKCTAATVTHPYIASIFDGGVHPKYGAFLVLESVDGTSVTHFCHHHRMSIHERLSLFIEICDGIEFIHENKCICRDLEPGNVLVTGEKETPLPKIVDFGVAILLSQQCKELRHLTESRSEYELPVYRAPEQIRLPDSELRRTCDIYSLGVLLYELIVGAPPFTDQQLAPLEYAERLRFLCDISPEPPSEKLSPSQIEHLCSNAQHTPGRLLARIKCDLDSVVLKCLQKDPDKRYQTVGELVADIKLFLGLQRTSVGSSSLLCNLKRVIWRKLNRG